MAIFIFDDNINCTKLAEYSALMRVKQQKLGMGNAVALTDRILMDFNVHGSNGAAVSTDNLPLVVAAIATLPVNYQESDLIKLCFEPDVKRMIAFKSDEYLDAWGFIDCLVDNPNKGIELQGDTYTSVFDYRDAIERAADYLGQSSAFEYVLELREGGYLPYALIDEMKTH